MSETKEKNDEQEQILPPPYTEPEPEQGAEASQVEEASETEEAEETAEAEDDEMARWSEEYDRNLEQTAAFLEAYAEQTGLDDAEMELLLKTVFRIIQEGLMGRIGRECLDMVRRGSAEAYAAAISEAREQGEIAGRNAKIREYLQANPALQPLADSSRASASPQRPQGIFSLAAGARR